MTHKSEITPATSPLFWNHPSYRKHNTVANIHASECPDVKNYKWRLNPVRQRMLYTL